MNLGGKVDLMTGFIGRQDKAQLVLNAIGLYTYSPADPEYIVTVLLFDKVTFDLHGNPFTIRKRGNGHKIKNITYGGKEIDGYFIEHRLLQQGKTLEIHVE